MSYEVIIDLSDVEHRSFDFKRMFDESIPCKERIVRCRDCVHYKPYRTHKHGMMNRCHDEHGHTHKRDESDFCSRGERRSE